jgi:hypothetical protein
MEMTSMAASLNFEEEHGIYTGTPHPHNGYYAGDFSAHRFLTQDQLAALYRSPGPGIPPTQIRK